MRAKNFFDRKNIPYDEVRIDENPDQIDTMIKKSGRRSVPQIFIGSELDYHIGGFDDLIEHDVGDKLEGLLED